MPDLSGKNAVITGAASGIGRATVDTFVEAGARVLAADVQDELGEELVQKHGSDRVRFVHCDVTNRQELDAAIRGCVSAFGGLDILFNNAGAAGTLSNLEEFDSDGFDRTVDLLLKSVFLGTHLALPHMKARGGGAIVNTSSISAFAAGHAAMVYSTCKIGVAHFSKLAAAELSKHKIRVNAVVPGLIGTSIFGKVMGLDNAGAQKIAEALTENGGGFQPLGRIGQGVDVAKAVAFLASDDAEFITGTEIVVDGGATIGPPQAWQAENPLESYAALLGLSAEELAALASK